jgi:hypothetical protein
MYLYIYTRNIHVYSSPAANNYVHQHIYRYQIYTCFVFLFEDILYRELNLWRLLWCEPFVWIKSSNKLSPKNRRIFLWCLKNPHQYWLVVNLPLWKIWVRQLGVLFSIYGKSSKSCSKPPSRIVVFLFHGDPPSPSHHGCFNTKMY